MLNASFSKRTTDLVATMMGVSAKDIMSATRRRPIAHARQAGMFLLREVKGYSFPMIGQIYGGRDHTTAIHAIEMVRKRVALDPEFASRLAVLLEEVRAMDEDDKRRATQTTTSVHERRIHDARQLPLRITTTQVCDLAGYGPQALARRIHLGLMPKPVDVGRERLFDRDAVLQALGLVKADDVPVASW